MKITKASGDLVTFSADKLRRSLARSGADDATIARVVREIESDLYEGVSTKKIYRRAFALLRRSSRVLAARYNLKQAIMDLGPSGYPFEKYVAALLQHQNYTTEVGVHVQGHCVQHEVDVLAQKNSTQCLIECKYRNKQGTKSDIKVPLYVHARFRDIERQWRGMPGRAAGNLEGWIVTNTRFSEDAVQYAVCMGLNLIGWDYPREGSLRERIEVSGVYPLTCLTTLSKAEKRRLLKEAVVLSRDLCGDTTALQSVGIPSRRLARIQREARDLCRLDGQG